MKLTASAEEAVAVLRAAHAAYTKTIRMQTISGETDTERRASQGEARDYAAEVMHGELGSLTFEHLDAIVAALAKPASSPAGGDVGDSVALSMDSDMRNSDFETWACKRGYLMHLHEGDESRRYRYSLTEEAWLGWCAALSQSTSAGRVGE